MYQGALLTGYTAVDQLPKRNVRRSTPVADTLPLELPPDTHPGWARLIKGESRHPFSYPAAGMLVFNCNLQWQRDPTKLFPLIRQVRSFFQKYNQLLASDISRLFG